MLLKIGAVYEHIKTGKHYKLIALAKDSHDLSERVVYEALYENSVSKYWVRSKEEFVGEAVSNDGSFHPRFCLIED
ncbi:DUF1653 domain-containing protein [Patescibacteria group bacterium]|nr:DUF1653 domain-containing protein [Patescibacteria group bacterium]